MIEYILGVITGILLSVSILIVLTYFKKQVTHVTEVIETRISAASPKPKGAIFNAPDESEDARQEIIERNQSQGKDTRISELQ